MRPRPRTYDNLWIVPALGLLFTGSSEAKEPTAADQAYTRQQEMQRISRGYQKQKLSRPAAREQLLPLVRQNVQEMIEAGILDQQLAELTRQVEESERYKRKPNTLAQERIDALLDKAKSTQRLHEAEQVTLGLERLKTSNPEAFHRKEQEYERRLAIYQIVKAFHKHDLNRQQAKAELSPLVSGDVKGLVTDEAWDVQSEKLRQRFAEMKHFKANPEALVEREVELYLGPPPTGKPGTFQGQSVIAPNLDSSDEK